MNAADDKLKAANVKAMLFGAQQYGYHAQIIDAANPSARRSVIDANHNINVRASTSLLFLRPKV